MTDKELIKAKKQVVKSPVDILKGDFEEFLSKKAPDYKNLDFTNPTIIDLPTNINASGVKTSLSIIKDYTALIFVDKKNMIIGVLPKFAGYVKYSYFITEVANNKTEEQSAH